MVRVFLRNDTSFCVFCNHVLYDAEQNTLYLYDTKECIGFFKNHDQIAVDSDKKNVLSIIYAKDLISMKIYKNQDIVKQYKEKKSKP